MLNSETWAVEKKKEEEEEEEEKKPAYIKNGYDETWDKNILFFFLFLSKHVLFCF
jgi:hypothetical protein